MKNFIYLFVLNCISIAVYAQEIVPGIVTKTKNAKGNEVYVFNNTRITGYDLEKFNMKDREKTFSALVELLPEINTPFDINNILNKTYCSIPYYVAQNLLFNYEKKPQIINLNDNTTTPDSWGRTADSIYITDGHYFFHQGKMTGGAIEAYYKICPLGRVNLNSDYYSIFIYNIMFTERNIFLNNYSKTGELLSSIEVLFSDAYYTDTDDSVLLYLRTVIDNDKRIHSVFMGGAATCNKYTMVLDSSGYFKTTKIQVYDWNSVPKALEDFTTSEIIDFKTGEILKAYISDPDGYTNVRKELGTSSPVLYKIYDNEPFYIITDILNGSWYKVALYEKKNEDGKTEELYEEGYIHQSRVEIVSKD
jgi:hypothetical protein